MELINSGTAHVPQIKQPLFLALGNFDGVHAGHQRIILNAVKQARRAGGKSAVLILDPHPVKVLRPHHNLKLLTDVADRAEIIKALGTDYLIVEQFTPQLAGFSPEQFVERILIRNLQVSGVAVGSDYSFGCRGAGTAETMRMLGDKYGFTVNVSPLVKVNQQVVSSSAIRTLLRAGAVKEAAGLLNYYFSRYGQVVKGDGIGRRLLFPTANIRVDERLLWPGSGVYLTAVGNLDDRVQFGLTNLGGKPTFKSGVLYVETHILDFYRDIYGRNLRIYFLEKLRDTRAFPNPDRLRSQIDRDIALARKLIATEYRDFRPGLHITAPIRRTGGHRS
jgi:riboflavin kinase/FMN adenylyltransferase